MNQNAPKNTDLSDRQLGEFRLLRQLGRGGMSEVYLADQTSLGRKVAVKVLRPEMMQGSDSVALKRFQQEARAAAGLTNQNIVQVYSVGAEDDVHFIVQEYVDGLNLAEYIKRNGPPETEIALHIMQQVASALTVAADAGIVHRDIKPENIMLTRAGIAKVADFGLAQLAQPGQKLNLTQDGTTMGTPLYMSPEQVNGKSLDARSDIYSFGVTAYHMLAGRPPFRGETALSVAAQHLTDEPEPLQNRRADIPPELCEMVHVMLRKDPTQRQESAKQLLQEIESLAEQLGSKTVRFRLQDTRSNPILQQLKTGMFPRILGLSLCVGLIAALLGWWLRPGQPFATDRKTVASTFPVKDSAVQQYALALRENNEYSWQAVIDNFPDSLEAKRAVSQLGTFYLLKNRYSDAQKQFENLVQLGSNDLQLKAKGLVGLARLAASDGDLDRAREIVEVQLLDLRDRIEPGTMEHDMLQETKDLLEL